MLSITVERIANLACLLDEPLQEKLWEYAELLYVEQVAFECTDAERAELLDPTVAHALHGEISQPPDTLTSGWEPFTP
jgi:hypothetical protein